MPAAADDSHSSMESASSKTDVEGSFSREEPSVPPTTMVDLDSDFDLDVFASEGPADAPAEVANAASPGQSVDRKHGPTIDRDPTVHFGPTIDGDTTEDHQPRAAELKLGPAVDDGTVHDHETPSAELKHGPAIDRDRTVNFGPTIDLGTTEDHETRSAELKPGLTLGDGTIHERETRSAELKFGPTVDRDARPADLQLHPTGPTPKPDVRSVTLEPAPAAAPARTRTISRAALGAVTSAASRVSAIPRERVLTAASVVLFCSAIVTAGAVVWVVRPPQVRTEAVADLTPPVATAGAAAVTEPPRPPPASPETETKPRQRPRATTERAAVAPSRSSPRSAPEVVPGPARTADDRLAAWVLVNAPFDLEMSIDGKVIGTTGSGEVMVPAGRHTVELANGSLGYRTTRVVTLPPGERGTLRIDVPTGRLSLDVAPWAEVLVGGQPMGRTPLRDLALPPGTHRVVLRHPELGDRSTTITIREGARTTLAMRMEHE